MKKPITLFIGIALVALSLAMLFVHATEWKSSAASDYNAGNGFDFNWTKVASDGNVMPVGSDGIYNDSNQTFYDQNLLVYLRFNDVNADGSGVPDDTNNGNSGHLLSGADVNAYGLWDTNAGFFDGVNNVIKIVNNSKLQQDFNSGILTITAWIFAKDVSTANKGIVSKSSGGGTTTIIFEFATNTGQGLKLYVGDGVGNSSWNSTLAFDLNKWQHVAVAMDGANYQFYINGMPAGNGALGRKPASVTNAVQIGPTFNQGSSPYHFDGYIEELKIYNRTLTASEIIVDYNAWMTGKYYSEIKDLNDWASAKFLQWDEITDVNNSITVDYRSCNDSLCGGESWVTGLAGGSIEHSLSSTNNRFFQYRVNFDTNKAKWNGHRTTNEKGFDAKFSDANVVYNRLPDGNVTKVESTDINQGLKYYSYVTDANLTINFTFFDWDGNKGQTTADINYHTSATQGSGTAIAENVDLLAICSPTDWNNTFVECAWDWNISGIGDNNYYVLLNVKDEWSDSNFDAGTYSFGVDNTAPTTTFSLDGSTATLACGDGLSGCKATGYSLDGAARTQGTTMVGLSEGTHSIDFNSIDITGNNEALQTKTFTVGTSSPTTGPSGPGGPSIVIETLDLNYSLEKNTLWVETIVNNQLRTIDEVKASISFPPIKAINEATGEEFLTESKADYALAAYSEGKWKTELSLNDLQKAEKMFLIAKYGILSKQVEVPLQKILEAKAATIKTAPGPTTGAPADVLQEWLSAGVFELNLADGGSHTVTNFEAIAAIIIVGVIVSVWRKKRGA